MVPLISPVKPLSTPIGHSCLCHKIKNEFQTQPPLQHGFLAPSWLVIERVKKSCPKDCQCPSGADTLSPGTHANTQLGRGHAGLPSVNLWSSKQWQETGTKYEVFSSHGSIWALIPQNKWTQTRKIYNRDPRSGGHYIYFFFFLMLSFFHLKPVITVAQVDTERSQCAILVPLHLPLASPGGSTGLRPGDNPESSGSFSDLKGSRVNALFPSTCLFPISFSFNFIFLTFKSLSWGLLVILKEDVI